jgi:hypothetical protein
MKKELFLLMFLLITSVVGQSKLGGGLYLNLGVAHNYKFQLNKILTDLETNKIPPIATQLTVGTHIDYQNVVYSLDLGIESMKNKQTWTTNFLTNLSIGYQLHLPQENSLIFSGNLSYELYYVYSYLSKGSLDMKTSILTSTQFSVYLHQFRVGAKIEWRSDKSPSIGIGYDLGCIPTTWKSDVVDIFDNSKERIDRIHFDITYDIRRF